MFGTFERRPVVIVDGDGPLSGLSGALALPLAERAAVGVGVGCALAGQPCLFVLGDAGRVAALAESLADAGDIAARGWRVPFVVVVDVDAVTAGTTPGLAALVASGVTVRWAAMDALPEAVGAAWSAGVPAVLLVGGDGAVEVSVTSPSARPRATALVLPPLAEGLAARADLDVVVWTSLGGMSDGERSALSASLQRTGRALVVVDASQAALAPLGIAAVVDAGFWWLEEPPRGVEPGDVDAALAGWS